jgi:predicted ATPase
MLTTLEITGLRGFASTQILKFAQPDGKSGSGLTAIVGANNTGKSTTIEALRAMVQRDPPSFTQGRRNQAAGDQVLIRAVDSEGKSTTLKNIRPGSSETEFLKEGDGIDPKRVVVLPARRVFAPYFGASKTTRSDYMIHVGFPAIRTSSMDQFTYRLFAIEKNRDAFDAVLKRILDPVPEWSIDQMDSGQHFLKIKKGKSTHSSEGLGEGLVSLLYIIDALYDSTEGDTIAVDEPELSLHPALQRKLSDLLVEYAATRQVVLSTHSPYFVGLSALPNGATVARTHVVAEESRISQLSSATAKTVFGLMRNENNPHILDVFAREIFFVEDRIILVEGQEDVVFFKKVESQTEPLRGTFFGWGVGGAENMERVGAVLKELGFGKVVGILDGNREQLAKELKEKFPDYHFFSIPANDVRTKQARPAKPEVKGLLNDNNDEVRPEFAERVRQLFVAANEYLHRGQERD